MATKAFGRWRAGLTSLPDGNDVALEGVTIITGVKSSVSVEKSVAYRRQGLRALERLPEVTSGQKLRGARRLKYHNKLQVECLSC